MAQEQSTIKSKECLVLVSGLKYPKELDDIPTNKRENYKKKYNAAWLRENEKYGTRMMNDTNGRDAEHLSGRYCDVCYYKFKKQEIQYKCLDCKNFDLCVICEGSGSPEEHAEGRHNFVKIQ